MSEGTSQYCQIWDLSVLKCWELTFEKFKTLLEMSSPIFLQLVVDFTCPRIPVVETTDVTWTDTRNPQINPLNHNPNPIIIKITYTYSYSPSAAYWFTLKDDSYLLAIRLVPPLKSKSGDWVFGIIRRYEWSVFIPFNDSGTLWPCAPLRIWFLNWGWLWLCVV